MTKEDVIKKYEPFPNKAEVNVIGVMMDEWAKHHAQLAFQAGYRLAAKHETNQPDDALELDDYINKMFQNDTNP